MEGVDSCGDLLIKMQGIYNDGSIARQDDEINDSCF